MKKVLCVGLLVGLWGGLQAFPASAITLSILLSPVQVHLDDTFRVDIQISGLKAVGVNEIVSAYDFDVTYNASILQATGVSFSSALGLSLQDFNMATTGLVELAELSLESDAVLAARQGDIVTLATVSFKAIRQGKSAITAVLDAFHEVRGRGPDALALAVQNGEVDVLASAVHSPEPGTWLLLGTGLVGMLAYGWRRRRTAP